MRADGGSERLRDGAGKKKVQPRKLLFQVVVEPLLGCKLLTLRLVAHYVTSRAGVIGLARSLARALGEYNITVNAIAPGLTMSMEDVSEAREAQNQQRFQARAIKRTEVPQDLVGTVVFLCSSDSDFMTGQTLVVDGGAQMH